MQDQDRRLLAAHPLAGEDQLALRAALAVPGSALCTVVGIDGSFSRRLGAQLAVAPDLSTSGSLADGCLERELAGQVAAMGGAGAPRVLRYGRGSPFIDFRLPCGSGLDILIDPAPDRAALERAVAALDARQIARVFLPLPGGLAGAGLLARRTYLPGARLAIFGAGPEASCLAALAGAFGLDHALHTPASGLALGRRPDGVDADPFTAVVLLFHDHEWELEILDWALSTEACFIGAIGGRPAREARREALAARGRDRHAIDRVRSPVGLIGHARDVSVLALSVLAEVVSEFEALRGRMTG